MSQSEDMEAVNRYMRTTPIVNNSAFPIKDDFIRWWDNLSWYDKNMSSAAWDEARTRRNKFQLANVKSEQERANVVKVITTGIESEEMQGKKRPTTLSTGEVGTQVTKPSSTLTAGGSISGPTLKKGSKGPDVARWQTILGVTADGNFGSGTESATKAWQLAHGLSPADGIVGPKTWAAASPKTSDFAKPGEVIIPSKPILSLNSKGPDVVQWQGIVGVKPATGFFGAMTVDYTKKWQSSHGLPATGIVDGKTWEVALKTGGAFAPAVQPQPTFAPTPSTPTFKPAPGVASKPSSSGTKPVASSGTKPSSEKKSKPPKVIAASMFDFSKWPGWAQIMAGMTAAAGVGYAIFGGKVRRLG